MAAFRHPTEPLALARREADGTETVVGEGQALDTELLYRSLKARLSLYAKGLVHLAKMPVHKLIQIGPLPPLRTNDEVLGLLSDALIAGTKRRGMIEDVPVVNSPDLRKRSAINWRPATISLPSRSSPANMPATAISRMTCGA